YPDTRHVDKSTTSCFEALLILILVYLRSCPCLGSHLAISLYEQIFPAAKPGRLWGWLCSPGSYAEIENEQQGYDNLDEKRIGKRLRGIARRWLQTFNCELNQYPDLVNTAWLFWLERKAKGIEDERAFEQVNSAMRRHVVREIWGYYPHQGKITSPAM